MNKKQLIMYLSEGLLVVAVTECGKVVGQKKFLPYDDNVNEITEMAQGVELALCPGGVLRPIGAGTYEITEAALADAVNNLYGKAPYNIVMMQCAAVAGKLHIPAYFTDAMSVDELLPLNRIRSHAKVPKFSRGFRAEHMAAMYHTDGVHRIENGSYIVAYIDDMVSVGAYSRGRCLDINDCVGAEGPMGFTSSGDVPCAQLANYFAKSGMKYSELETCLQKQSGLKQYLGTTDPEKVDELCASPGEKSDIVDSMVYQIAKWIGSSALVLQGRVDKIIVTGKGIRSKGIMDRLEKKVSPIAPVSAVSTDCLADYLAAKAMLIGSFADAVLTY